MKIAIVIFFSIFDAAYPIMNAVGTNSMSRKRQSHSWGMNGSESRIPIMVTVATVEVSLFFFHHSCVEMAIPVVRVGMIKPPPLGSKRNDIAGVSLDSVNRSCRKAKPL